MQVSREICSCFMSRFPNELLRVDYILFILFFLLREVMDLWIQNHLAWLIMVSCGLSTGK